MSIFLKADLLDNWRNTRRAQEIYFCNNTVHAVRKSGISEKGKPSSCWLESVFILVSEWIYQTNLLSCESVKKKSQHLLVTCQPVLVTTGEQIFKAKNLCKIQYKITINFSHWYNKNISNLQNYFCQQESDNRLHYYWR